MRLIDADSFADRMYREAFEKDSDDQKWDSGCWIRYKMFERVLREAPTIELEQKWIPCSERLPEVGAVLIADGNEILIGEYYGDSTWSVDGCDYNPDLEKIAWMPLPEPYHNS